MTTESKGLPKEPARQHFVDDDDNPAGGYYRCVGLSIRWQNGPLGRGPERKPQNGAFVEEVLIAAMDRLQFYQRSKCSCEENAAAIKHIESALAVLQARTARREKAGTEGTHCGR